MSQDLLSLALAVALSIPVAARADHELRTPQTELEIDLGLHDPAVSVRVYWSCYERDLGEAARAVAARHEAEPDCDLIRDHYTVVYGSYLGEVEEAAGKLPIGDTSTGARKDVDPDPGETVLIEAEYCYDSRALEEFSTWVEQRLLGLCSADRDEDAAAPAADPSDAAEPAP